jgi:membrane protein DedA with SNARE-associated domain
VKGAQRAPDGREGVLWDAASLSVSPDRELMTPTVDFLVSRYGLVVVGMGTLIEGETVLLVAGAVASRGVLDPAAVWIVAASGAWLGHVIWFGVGRFVGQERMLAVFPQWGRQLDALDALIRRRSWICIFSLQYLYGLRLLGAVALGLSRLPIGRFLVAEALNCLTWAALVGALGYVAGESASALFQHFGRVMWLFVTAIVVVAIVHRTFRNPPTSERARKR